MSVKYLTGKFGTGVAPSRIHSDCRSTGVISKLVVDYTVKSINEKSKKNVVRSPFDNVVLSPSDNHNNHKRRRYQNG